MRSLIQNILSREENHSRFEEISCRIVQQIEGRAVVTTSYNYDQQRDGVSLGGSSQIVVCVTLESNTIDEKIASDLEGCLKKAKGANFPIHKIFYCTKEKPTVTASDKARNALAKRLRFPSENILVLPVGQLAQIIEQNPDCLSQFKRLYGREIADQAELAEKGDDVKESIEEMNLVLAILEANDSTEIRECMWVSFIRLALRDGNLSLDDLAKKLTSMLSLPQLIGPGCLRVHVQRLILSEEVEEHGDVLRLLVKGQLAAENLVSLANQAISTHKKSLQEAIESAIGQPLSPNQMEKMWDSVEKTFLELLHTRGRIVVNEALRLLEGGRKRDSEAPFLDIVDPLAKAAGRPFTLPAQKSEVETAFRDLLITGADGATDWFLKACYGYIAACSLGLEDTTQRTLHELIEKSYLLLDTDVLLSLLCEDEPFHAAAVEVVSYWKKCKGKVLVSEEVLSEVAHHAWNARKDFRDVQKLLPGNSLTRKIWSNNAFVRGFGALLEKKITRLSQWELWISRFAGSSKVDATPIAKTLLNPRADYKFSTIESISPKGEKAVMEKALKRSVDYASPEDSDNPIFIDKARRDASLFSKIVSARTHLNKSGSKIYLITSSSRFRKLEEEFITEEDGSVHSLQSILYLMSLAPDVKLSPASLRVFLFDSKIQYHVPDFLIKVRRIISHTKEFDMPWAKRTDVEEFIYKRVGRIAKERSTKDHQVSDRQVEKDLLKEGRINEIIAEGLDLMAVDPKTKKEKEKLTRELAEEKKRSLRLEAEIRELKKKKK